MEVVDNSFPFLLPVESRQTEFVCSSYGQNSEGVSGDLELEFFLRLSSNSSCFLLYKARLIANRCSQQYGVDCDDTFSLPIHQLDVKNAFLNGDLSETVYMYQPPGFVDPRFPHHVCRLQRSLYGLKQAPRAWFHWFAGYALRVGFSSSRCDSSLFIYQHGSEVVYLLIYVDDIVLTASSTDLLQRIISSLHKEFDMTDLGALNYFLCISVTRDSTGMFLSQKKYAMELLDRAHMASCNPTRTPVDTESKLGADGDPVSDPILYRSLAGSLQYLTFTRPDISYAVQQVCLYMHDPREPHFLALKRILRYVRGTLDFGLQLYASSTGSLVAYTDADWAGFPTTRCSTSGYCVFLGDNLLSWSSKRQHTLSRSSTEAEYKGVANVVAETEWLRNVSRCVVTYHEDGPKSPSYSLELNDDNEIPMMTEEHGIKFYVKSSNEFDDKYPLETLARADIENTIISDYIHSIRYGIIVIMSSSGLYDDRIFQLQLHFVASFNA
ncbi:ribonuclease H-like domain-containing protein [Tanacetum coccineum]